MNCRCGSSLPFSACCEPLLAGALAPKPERLMRSRFVAYGLGDLEYILRTTDPQRRLEVDAAAVRGWMEDSDFTRLEVLRASDEGNKGSVEFIAHFVRKAGGPAQTHHELSKFRKLAGVWYFRQGRIIQ